MVEYLRKLNGTRGPVRETIINFVLCTQESDEFNSQVRGYCVFTAYFIDKLCAHSYRPPLGYWLPSNMLLILVIDVINSDPDPKDSPIHRGHEKLHCLARRYVHANSASSWLTECICSHVCHCIERRLARLVAKYRDVDGKAGPPPQPPHTLKPVAGSATPDAPPP